MDRQIDFSLVIVNYRSGRYLAGALESLGRAEDVRRFEVIVVNNDSDESRLLAGLQRVFSFRLIESGENLGFGGGNNLGVQAARGTIVGFINPDTLWGEAKLEAIARLFQSDGALGARGLSLVTLSGQPERWSYGKEPTLARLLRHNLLPFLDHVLQGQADVLPTVPEAADWVSGGALFMRKEVFEMIGGYDERFFLYFEDVDLCRRVRERGYTVRHASSLPLSHYGGKSHPSSEMQKKNFFASQDRYFAKHRPPIERTVLRFCRFVRYGF